MEGVEERGSAIAGECEVCGCGDGATVKFDVECVGDEECDVGGFVVEGGVIDTSLGGEAGGV